MILPEGVAARGANGEIWITRSSERGAKNPCSFLNLLLIFSVGVGDVYETPPCVWWRVRQHPQVAQRGMQHLVSN